MYSLVREGVLSEDTITIQSSLYTLSAFKRLEITRVRLVKLSSK